MSIEQESLLSVRSSAQVSLPSKTSLIGGLLEWPRIVWLYGIGILLLYAPEVWTTSHAWFTNQIYSHGVLIFPLSAFILWLQRDRIRSAKREPIPAGLFLLGFALLLQVGSYLLQVRYIGMWSLIPMLAGSILVLHGMEMWRITRFAVLFLVFAMLLPNTLLRNVNLDIQTGSTVVAATLVQTLGVPLVRAGNLLRLPGVAVEVAEVCSGYSKLIALMAFAALYGYMYPMRRTWRIALILAAAPIALLVNALRIAGLMLISTMFGLRGLHLAHDWAEAAALCAAFGIYVIIGKQIGCDTIRFSLQSER